MAQFARNLSASFVKASNEFEHAIRGCLIFKLAVKSLAHSIDFTALQPFVKLAPFAERAHHHVRRCGEEAQMFARARRARAKIALDQRTDLWVIEIRGAAA